jgi:putative oxidoreductase
VVIGLFTRLASLALVFTMGVAFAIVHDANFSGSNSGEMAFLYGLVFLVLLVAGGGKFSLDRKLGDSA